MRCKLLFDDKPEDYYSKLWDIPRKEIEDLIQIATRFTKNLNNLKGGKFQKISEWLYISYRHKITYKRWRRFTKYLRIYEERNGKWKKSYSGYPVNWTNTLKQSIKQRDKYTCQICKQQKNKLVVHHIDYIKNNCNPNNLVTLCYHCHNKTNSNRQHWIEYFANMNFQSC